MSETKIDFDKIISYAVGTGDRKLLLGIKDKCNKGLLLELIIAQEKFKLFDDLAKEEFFTEGNYIWILKICFRKRLFKFAKDSVVPHLSEEDVKKAVESHFPKELAEGVKKNLGIGYDGDYMKELVKKRNNTNPFDFNNLGNSIRFRSNKNSDRYKYPLYLIKSGKVEDLKKEILMKKLTEKELSDYIQGLQLNRLKEISCLKVISEACKTLSSKYLAMRDLIGLSSNESEDFLKVCSGISKKSVTEKVEDLFELEEVDEDRDDKKITSIEDLIDSSVELEVSETPKERDDIIEFLSEDIDETSFESNKDTEYIGKIIECLKKPSPELIKEITMYFISAGSSIRQDCYDELDNKLGDDDYEKLMNMFDLIFEHTEIEKYRKHKWILETTELLKRNIVKDKNNSGIIKNRENLTREIKRLNLPERRQLKKLLIKNGGNLSKLYIESIDYLTKDKNKEWKGKTKFYIELPNYNSSKKIDEFVDLIGKSLFTVLNGSEIIYIANHDKLNDLLNQMSKYENDEIKKKILKKYELTSFKYINAMRFIIQGCFYKGDYKFKIL